MVSVEPAMKFPIKLNRSAWPGWLCALVSSAEDMRTLGSPGLTAVQFEKLITSIRVGGTWKSTRANRHLLTDEMIGCEVRGRRQVSLLDIGASSGVTSLELIRKLDSQLHSYYVSDIGFDIRVIKSGKYSHFYPMSDDQCIMSVSDNFVFYCQKFAKFFPLGNIANLVVSQAPDITRTECEKLSLIHPDLHTLLEKDSRIRLAIHDVLNPWHGKSVDLVKIANVLNRSYFSDSQINIALRNLSRALNVNGVLVVTDNRDLERVSLFRKNSDASSYMLLKSVNGGTDIEDLILRL
jgi:SAM-dependent methyltransferase